MTYPSRKSPARKAAGPLAAVIAGVLLILCVRALAGGGDSNPTGSGQPQTHKPSACDGAATELTVAVSPEKTAILNQVAADYGSTDGRSDVGCVAVKIVEKSSGAAQLALARGWNETIDGPRPDVWSPSSSSWPRLLTHALTQADKPTIVPDGDLPSLVRSPLVIAMPKPMAQALGWPGKQPGWSDLLALSKDPAGWGKHGHPEWGPFRIGKTNPELSTSGLHALVGANFAATGLAADLTLKNVNDPKVRTYVSGIEQAAEHYGPTTLAFLASQAKADREGRGLSYVSAIAVEEKSLLDYNRGDASVGGNGNPPKTPLAAIYPAEGTVISDNPYVVLTASWVDAAKQAAAADFLTFATGQAAQKRFTEVGFRAADGTAGAIISQNNGVLAEQPKIELAAPAPSVLDAIRGSWRELRKKARVLLVIDRSGSMHNENRLEQAREAALKALDGFGPQDQVGLATFSSDYRVDVPIAAMSGNKERLRKAISSMNADGGTLLYDSTKKAHAQIVTEYQKGLINAVVVMTDGEDTDSRSSIDQLIGDLQPDADRTRPVRVFTIAFGEGADLGPLARIALAAEGLPDETKNPTSPLAYDARRQDKIEKVLQDVVSNF